ncbi:MAG: Fis family transcriptional regulator, partial [Spirochaetes bacterium]|nr:Fis family transcriptional regulator [Spirochaetota bacterium]
LPEQPLQEIDQSKTLKIIERKHITTILEKCNWKIKGTNGAAEILGLKPSTLRDKMKKLGIKRPKAR